MTPTDYIYIAGPMRGIPEFNFPAFFAAEEVLHKIFPNAMVFNPARRDNEAHGVDISKGNATGDEGQAREEHGFDLREALGADLHWICSQATAVYLLKGWEKSRGAQAERAVARTLGIKLIYQNFDDREKVWDYDTGFAAGHLEGYRTGWADGEEETYASAYDEGYEAGCRDTEQEATNAE